MDIVELIRAVAALAATLGLIGLAAWGFRRFGPEWLSRFQGPGRPERRLKLVESLTLDPQRRLCLVSLDGQERLILLGDGKTLDQPRPAA